MKMHNLDSASPPAAIGYSSKDRHFAVQFAPEGKTYLYLNVPPEKFVAAIEAPSLGKFIATEIKTDHAVVVVETVDDEQSAKG